MAAPKTVSNCYSKYSCYRLSDGRCRFVMATDKKWTEIEEKLK